MDIVLDSNILFSALISGKAIYIDIFKSFKIYVPDFIFIELSKYQKRIIKKTKLENEFTSFIRELFTEITVIPKMAISQNNWEKAIELCKDIDLKDTPFLALSIELEIPLWTNDKKLSEKLKQKGFDNFISTDEIFLQAIESPKI